MSQTVPTQNPAVVLRCHYRHLKGLLAVVLIALVSLSVTVVMLARDDDRAATAPVSQVTTAKPDESKLAAAISMTQARQETGGPDESRIAAAVGDR